ncbi:MAG: right-handed parallel beta-helix repeat-containing protein [Candidatus Eisenbacteria sp.]|nr:right-handed parallel beta-helix repeat-containing protein [Candidatus Eisenbacteria bacterium]
MNIQRLALLLAGLFCVILAPPHAEAQLTGLKYIGGVSPHYATLEDAIADLNTQGVGDGGVTFLIRDGVYEENDNLIISDVDATSESPVVFRPDVDAIVAINVTITGEFSSAFRIHNSDHITFNGSPHESVQDTRNMTVSGYRNADDDVFVFWLSNGSDNCSLDNLIIHSISEPPYDSGWSTPVYCSTYQVPQPSLGMDSFILSNCEIVGGSTFGVFLDCDTGMELRDFRIAGNTIRDWQKMGIKLDANVVDCDIEGNQIYQTFEMARSSVYGISVGGTNSGTNIHHNYIHDLRHSELSGSKGIYLYGNSDGNVVYDNIVYLFPGISANSSVCLNISSGDGTNNRFLYNTLYMGGVDTRGTKSYCLRSSRELTDHELKNNIILNERTGGDPDDGHYALRINAADAFAESDYNFLSVNSEEPLDNRFVAMIGTELYNTLADLLAAPGYAPRDEHSLSGDPGLNMEDLHLESGSACIEAGTPLVGITTDIDYDLRDPVTPDMGADEYVESGGLADEDLFAVQNAGFLRCVPNPCAEGSRGAAIHFRLAEQAQVEVAICDLQGRLLRLLLVGLQAAGNHVVQWDGRSENGAALPAGAYFCRIKINGGLVESTRMILLR